MVLKQLVKELEVQAPLKWDKPGLEGSQLLMNRTGKLCVLSNGGSAYGITRPASQQIAEKLEIPWKYYEKMLEGDAPLLMENVNTWLHKDPERKFFIRGLQDDVRAFLSDKYRVIDHLDVLMCSLNELQSKAEVEDCHLSGTNMYVKLKTPELKSFIKHVGDEVVGGMLLSNSETGHGAVNVKPRIFRVQCLNGMVMENLATRRVHLGSGAVDVEDDMIFLDIRRAIRGLFQQFGDIVNQLRDSTEVTLREPNLVINNVVREYGLSEKQKENVLMSFGMEPDRTQYGVANAITRAAQMEEKFESGLDLEKLGGRLVEMTPDNFGELSRN